MRMLVSPHRAPRICSPCLCIGPSCGWQGTEHQNHGLLCKYKHKNKRFLQNVLEEIPLIFICRIKTFMSDYKTEDNFKQTHRLKKIWMGRSCICHLQLSRPNTQKQVEEPARSRLGSCRAWAWARDSQTKRKDLCDTNAERIHGYIPWCIWKVLLCEMHTQLRGHQPHPQGAERNWNSHCVLRGQSTKYTHV